jgi:hypothetical protein
LQVRVLRGALLKLAKAPESRSLFSGFSASLLGGRKPSMTSAESLQAKLLSAGANETFTEAVLSLQDGSRLCFCHRVGERWAKAVGPEGREENGGLAGALLPAVTMFRLNAKHLDVQFADGSRWEQRLRESDGPI